MLRRDFLAGLAAVLAGAVVPAAKSLVGQHRFNYDTPRVLRWRDGTTWIIVHNCTPNLTPSNCEVKFIPVRDDV